MVFRPTDFCALCRVDSDGTLYPAFRKSARLCTHCFDRIVIHGYLSGLSRPEQVVHFVRHVLGIPVVSKEVLSRRTDDYRNWVEAYARNHKLPIQWAEKGLRKEDHVLPALRRMEKRGAYGVYFIFKSMEQGRTFRITVPKYPVGRRDFFLRGGRLFSD